MKEEKDHLRFHLPHLHLSTTFGNDWFSLKAESFARFFGTAFFLGFQTIVVLIWICLNVFGFTNFDVYPFILLNLAFSLQAAYAAPLILLAQTRQAARDKAHTDATSRHREEIALENSNQQERMIELMEQNTNLSSSIKNLTEHIDKLTAEVHDKVIRTGFWE